VNNRMMRLQRTRTKPRDLVFKAFDIEYTIKGGELIEGCIGDEDEQQFYSTWPELIEALFAESASTKNLWFIVHAGDIAEYAKLIKFLRSDPIYRQEIELDPVYSGESMIALTMIRGKKKVKIRDMFALFPMGLAKIAEKFAPEYPKIESLNGRKIDFSKKDYNPQTDREYLRRDVQATACSYKNICKMIFEQFGVQPSLSAAGTAMKAWLYELPAGEKHFRLNPTAEDFCREGYYGAYVHPGKDNNIHQNVCSYDITAAYGARMRNLFPVGNPVYSHYYNPDKMGMWNCTITCIDSQLPIVPYRKKNGINWLGVAGDTCETTITSIEIEYFKAHGYTVDVHYGVYWEESRKIFSDFIDKVERVESINSTTKQCAKLMRNSLYGRFGTKKIHNKFVISADIKEGYQPYCNPQTGELIEDLYQIEEELEVPYIQPHWAAFITAYQRLAMFDLIFKCGLENFLGCDTDSVKTYVHIVEEKQLPISETAYGDGKIEATWDIYRSHGPKNYVGYSRESIIAKTKGIPKKALTQEMLHEHLYRDEHTQIKVKFSSITKALAMLKNDGRSEHNNPRHRTLSSLHSEKWTLKNECFVPISNVV